MTRTRPTAGVNANRAAFMRGAGGYGRKGSRADRLSVMMPVRTARKGMWERNSPVAQEASYGRSHQPESLTETKPLEEQLENYSADQPRDILRPMA